MDEYRQKVRYGIEILTRLRAQFTGTSTEDMVTSARTGIDTVTGLAGAGLLLALVAGIEHGIRDEAEAVSWALERVSSLVGDEGEAPTMPQVVVEDVNPAGMMTIHRLIGLLNVLAAQLPMGVDSEVRVGVQGKDGIQVGDEVAVTTMTEVHQDGRSGAWGFVSGLLGQDAKASQPRRDWAAPDIVSHFLTHCVREARGADGFAGEWAAIQGFAAEIGSRQTDAVHAAREAGSSWEDIAAVTGEPVAELRAKYERA